MKLKEEKERGWRVRPAGPSGFLIQRLVPGFYTWVPPSWRTLDGWEGECLRFPSAHKAEEWGSRRLRKGEQA